MAEQTLDLNGIASRLERLERENRRLKQIGVSLALLATVMVVMGQGHSSRTIEAEKFVLRDANGNSRAVLGMVVGMPTLTLSDAKGVPMIVMEGGDDPLFSLSRNGGKEQVTMLAREELYGLAIYGEPKGPINGTRVGVGVWKGVPGLTLYDESGKEVAAIQTERSGPSLKLEDERGYSAIFGTTDLIAPSTGRKEMTSAASLTLFGKDKKVLWSAP